LYFQLILHQTKKKCQQRLDRDYQAIIQVNSTYKAFAIYGSAIFRQTNHQQMIISREKERENKNPTDARVIS
jgi:hypothetical protein